MWRSLSLALKSGIVVVVLGVTAVPSSAEDSSQAAVWAPRKLHLIGKGFQGPYAYTCEGFRDDMKAVLLQLGARESDLDVREYACPPYAGVDATFWVPVPVSATGSGKNGAGALVEAHWQTVELKLGGRACKLLQQVQQQILPLFSTRDAKLSVDRTRCLYGLDGGSLRVQVLRSPQELAASP